MQEDKPDENGPARATRNATFVTDSIQQSLCGGLHCWAVGQNSQPCMSNWLATQAQNFKVGQQPCLLSNIGAPLCLHLLNAQLEPAGVGRPRTLC